MKPKIIRRPAHGLSVIAFRYAIDSMRTIALTTDRAWLNSSGRFVFLAADFFSFINPPDARLPAGQRLC